MLDSLITSKTRMKLLLKFFSNSSNSSYLRGLADEFGESTNSVRVELNRLTEAGLLKSSPSGNTILYRANTSSTLFPDIKAMVGKYLGFDKLVEQVIDRLGDVELALITGDYAKGNDSGIIDLVLVGEFDYELLYQYISKAEKLINRKVRPLVLSKKEYQKFNGKLEKESHIVLWGQINTDLKSIS